MQSNHSTTSDEDDEDTPKPRRSGQPTLFDAEPDPWQLDAAHEALTASVVFAEQPWGPYDYGVPAKLAAKLKPGQRVQVPLGKGNRSVVG